MSKITRPKARAKQRLRCAQAGREHTAKSPTNRSTIYLLWRLQFSDGPPSAGGMRRDALRFRAREEIFVVPGAEMA